MTEVDRRCISDDQSVLFIKWLAVILVSAFSLVGLAGLISREPLGAGMLLVAAISGVLLGGVACGSAHVEMDDFNLYIASKSGEVTVPRTQIDRVLETIGSHNFITVTFKETTDVGRQVKFIARAEGQRLWRSHPIVAELQKENSNTRMQEVH